MKQITRVALRLLLGCLAVPAVICAGCASWQRHQIFLPRHYTPDQVNRAAARAKLERWYNSSGQPIGMKRLSVVQPAKGRLLIVYGNASWAVGCARYINDLQAVAPFDVYVLEYPGYADRPGSPSEEVVFQAADEAIQTLGTNQPVYILGESLGTGVAAHLAGAFPHTVAGLILLSPFNRLTGVAQYQVPYLPAWLILVDRFPSEVYLCRYHGPVGITVDGLDTIVPEKFGRRLYDGYAGPKRLWEFPGSQHIAIGEPHPQFWREVLDFWNVSSDSHH